MNRKKSGEKGEHHSSAKDKVQNILQECQTPRGRRTLASLTTMHQDQQLTEKALLQIKALLHQL